jgi:hypothetical protein
MRAAGGDNEGAAGSGGTVDGESVDAGTVGDSGEER